MIKYFNLFDELGIFVGATILNVVMGYIIIIYI